MSLDGPGRPALVIGVSLAMISCGAGRSDSGDATVVRDSSPSVDPDRASSAREYLVRAAETHVLIVDGRRIPADERVSTARRLDPADFESIEFIGSGDPRGRELIGEEAGKTGAIVILTKDDDPEGGTAGV